MSRPFHPLLSTLFLASALGLAGCFGTIYRSTYSYKKNYFKPPEEDKKEASAETILGALDKKSEGATPDAAPGAPPAGDAAGMPAGLPAPDAGVPAMPPAAAPAPAAAPPAK